LVQGQFFRFVATPVGWESKQSQANSKLHIGVWARDFQRIYFFFISRNRIQCRKRKKPAENASKVIMETLYVRTPGFLPDQLVVQKRRKKNSDQKVKELDPEVRIVPEPDAEAIEKQKQIAKKLKRREERHEKAVRHRVI
jgi:hypothetical protein